MTTFDTLTLALPAHWLPVFFNGDNSHLDDAEYAALCRWEADMLQEFGPLTYALPGAAEPHFARYHDAAEYGVLACDCYDVTVMFEEPADVMEAA